MREFLFNLVFNWLVVLTMALPIMYLWNTTVVNASIALNPLSYLDTVGALAFLMIIVGGNKVIFDR